MNHPHVQFTFLGGRHHGKYMHLDPERQTFPAIGEDAGVQYVRRAWMRPDGYIAFLMVLNTLPLDEAHRIGLDLFAQAAQPAQQVF